MNQETIDGWMREAYGLHQAGDPARAEPIYKRILEHQPDNADAWYLLGEIEAVRGNHARAAEMTRRAIALNGKESHFHYALGCALQAIGDTQGAADEFRRTLVLDPSHAAAHINLGSLQQVEAEKRAAPRELEDALEHFRAASRIAPNHAGPWLNIGYAMERDRRLEDAIGYFDRALALDPGLAEAHFNRSLALLALGRWREGWREYEWRWQASGFPRPQLGRPEWNGEALGGRNLLVYTEQGFGDAIQFARFAAPAAERNARVVLRCGAELQALLSSAPGISSTVRPDEPPPDFAAHCSLLSLPRILGVTRETCPARVPYVAVAGALLERWRSRVRAAGGGPRVGLVWSSQPLATRIAPLKSIDLQVLSPLQDVPGIRYYNLQMGEAGKQALRPGAAPRMVDLTAEIRDFSDTAALIASLDLVISVDTAVVHLAGALGKPVWVLLQYAPDWRWYPDGDACVWYPTLRMYRQQRRGDWPEVIARVARDLRTLSGLPATSRT